jgi:hypothetical protein
MAEKAAVNGVAKVQSKAAWLLGRCLSTLKLETRRKASVV